MRASFKKGNFAMICRVMVVVYLLFAILNVTPLDLKAKADSGPIAYKFDFGTGSSPVEEGYIGVPYNLAYDKARGYGIDETSAARTEKDSSRDRGEPFGSPKRDFVMGAFSFMVDLPNGDYSVKVIAGDNIAQCYINLSIEGKQYLSNKRINTAEFGEYVFNITITDGQMNFDFTDSRINAIEIYSMLEAPKSLSVSGKTVTADTTAVSLSWNSVNGASSYNVYRLDQGDSEFKKVGSSDSLQFTDSGLEIGFTYSYRVTTVNSAGFESDPSNEIQVTMVDGVTKAPAAPLSFELKNIERNTLTFRWAAADNVIKYIVYRSKSIDGKYERIGETTEAEFTDNSVLTSIPFYYKVVAVNLGGLSSESEAFATPIGTTLYRRMETLDRGLIAIKVENCVYLGWRLFATDDPDIGFNIYRNGVKINKEPITTSTNYLDMGGTADSIYTVAPVLHGVEQAQTDPVSVIDSPYLSIPLKVPKGGKTPDGVEYTYSANDLSVGDLDGDGQYELVLKWDPSNSQDNANTGYTGNVYLDAYELDGTFMWRIDLGKNIRAGAHYTQFMVYDLDGDGKAEIACKTADGTIDGKGNVIGDPKADWLAETLKAGYTREGYILKGPEYLTIFEGATGKALVTTDYDPPRGAETPSELSSMWGDNYGNRVDRFLACIAYLDGEMPSLVMCRGYYTRTVLVAYNWRDGKLTKLWKFDSNDEGNAAYAGQGNHNLSVADVDNDGLDEIIYGACVIDHDGTGLYTTGLGHGDAMHVSDLDPSRPGLEVWSVHEDKAAKYGAELRNAETGEIYWGVYTGKDTGRGLAADIDPRYKGAEFWAASNVGVRDTSGNLISSKMPSINFAIWWDADLSRELLDGNSIRKWDYENSVEKVILTAEGCSSNNGTKSNPGLSADILGDWREEVIWRTDDSSELRIYTTTDVTQYRIYTLMHDPVYRLGIAWQNVAYNQPPHTSFYLGTDMTSIPTPNIYRVTEEAKINIETDTIDTSKEFAASNIKVSMELSGEYDTADINIPTVKMTIYGNTIKPQSYTTFWGDADNNGVEDVTLRFSRADIISAIGDNKGNIKAEVRGFLRDGKEFSGVCYITVK